MVGGSAGSVFLVSGPIAVGKSQLTEQLVQRFGVKRVSTRSLLIRASGRDDREALIKLGDTLDTETQGKWVIDQFLGDTNGAPDKDIWLVDAVRTIDQVSHFREKFGSRVVMQSDGWTQAPPTLLGFDFNRPEQTGRAAATRAIMEAAAYAACEHLKMLERLSGNIFPQIVFSGGASQGSLWPKIVADVLGRPVVIPDNSESTSVGCAMLASVGAGLFSNLDEAGAMAAKPRLLIEPDLDRTAVYEGLSQNWLRLNDAMIGLAESGLATPMWRPAGARRKKSQPAN